MTAQEAIEAAERERSNALYVAEIGANKGIRAIGMRKAEWLSKLIYLAEKAIFQSESDK